MEPGPKTHDTKLYQNQISTGKTIPLHSWPLYTPKNDDSDANDRLLWQFNEALEKGNVTRKPQNEETHLQEAKEIIAAKVDVVNSGSGSSSITTTTNRLAVLLARTGGGMGAEGDVKGSCLFEEFWREKFEGEDEERGERVSKDTVERRLGAKDEEDEFAAFECWIEDNVRMLLTGGDHVFFPVSGVHITLTFMPVLDQPGRVFRCVLLRRLEDVVPPSLQLQSREESRYEQKAKEPGLVDENWGTGLRFIGILLKDGEENLGVHEEDKVNLGKESMRKEAGKSEGSESSGTLEHDIDEDQNSSQEDMSAIENQNRLEETQMDTTTKDSSEEAEAVDVDLTKLKLDDPLTENLEKSVEVKEGTRKETK